mgnify:CR=1 FL=1
MKVYFIKYKSSAQQRTVVKTNEVTIFDFQQNTFLWAKKFTIG